MSKWIDQFEAHPFQDVWINLKNALQESTIDDETVVTLVSELARLRKVIEYLDGMLQTVDPELVPVNTWDNFNTQATTCLQHITNYNTNRNFAHIDQANILVDALLSYLRPYMVLPKDAAASVKRASTIYLKTIEEYMESFHEKTGILLGKIERHNLDATKIFSEIERTKDAIDTYESLLFGENGDAGVQSEISDLRIEIGEKYTKINELYNELLIGDETDDSIKKAIFSAKESILEEQEKIEGLLASVSDEVDSLGKFYTKIFGVSGENKKRTGGLSQELTERTNQLSTFETSQKTKYEALIKEIETLLPGATSAGLATAYKDLKDSFDTPIKNASNIFYGTLGLLVFVSFLLAIKSLGGESWIEFVSFDEWDTVFKGLAYKIPFYAPVLWLAFYVTKRRSEYQRLQQEYAHKEAIAKSYNSYKKQIQELGEDGNGMQKELIIKALEAIAYNASETLDGKHGDKMFAQEAFESAVNAVIKLRNP